MERSEKQAPQVRFLHVRHAERDIEPVWLEARKADIILLEAPGSTVETNQLSAKGIIETANIQNPVVKILFKHAFMKRFTGSDPFLLGFVSNAIDEKKELYFIDTPFTEIAFLETQIAFGDLKLSRIAFAAGELRDSYNLFVKGTIMLAKGTQDRDKITLRQIEEMITENQNWVNKKVTVVQGADHTQVYHNFVKNNPNISASRTFMSMDDGIFSFSHEFRKRMEKNQDTKILDLLLKRDFIQTNVIYPSLLRLVPDYIERTHVCLKLVRSLPDSEIQHMFNDIQKVEAMTSFLRPLEKAVHVKMGVSHLGDAVVERYKNIIKKQGY